MERCPECRARLKGRVTCGRCEADMGILYAIESQADILSRRALKALLEGDLKKATRQAVDARGLHATPFHRALASFLENLRE